MEEHYTNKVRSFDCDSIEELEDCLNEFYQDKFIIATQVFNRESKWYAIVYFKIPPLQVKEKVIVKENQVIKNKNKSIPSDSQLYVLINQIGLTEKEALSLDFQEAFDRIKKFKGGKK